MAVDLGKNSAVNTPLAPGVNMEMKKEKDATESATGAKFGDVLQRMQAQYGAKAEKPREIKKTLGKDDFLRIMLTQMRNQDPTSPFKAEQMATEMAQFTSVEQLQNLNASFAKFAGQNQPLEKLAMTQMIGKLVTVDRDRFPHIEGEKEALSIVLPKDATQVQVEVVNDQGETLHRQELGNQKAGIVSFTWDGLKANRLPAKAGNYQIRAQAVDARGTEMDLNNQVKARIAGVSFEGNEPILLVSNGSRLEKITMKNIVRVEPEPTAAAPAPAAAAPGVAPAAASSPAVLSGQMVPVDGGTQKSFFTFEKGQGSRPIEAADLPAQALEKGFPSGLGDPEQQGVQNGLRSEKGGGAT